MTLIERLRYIAAASRLSSREAEDVVHAAAALEAANAMADVLEDMKNTEELFGSELEALAAYRKAMS